MILSRSLFAALCLAVIASSQARAGIMTTVEAAGVQVSSASNTTLITFNGVSAGDYTSLPIVVSANLTVTYTTDTTDPFKVLPADQFGGADDPVPTPNSNYFVTGLGSGTTSATATLSQKQGYFGFWWSAADSQNQLQFYNDGTLVGSFTSASSVIAGLSNAYYGNPTTPFFGQNTGEPYVFINFYATDDASKFNSIVFLNSHNTGFESDNHTFSADLQPPPVPEPSTVASAAVALVFSGVWARRRSRKATGR